MITAHSAMSTLSQLRTENHHSQPLSHAACPVRVGRQHFLTQPSESET
jgi:hypothetical protein